MPSLSQMLKLLPLILLILYSVAMWRFSALRTRRELAANSTPLTHPLLAPMLARLGRAMDLPPVRARVYEIDAVNGLAAPDGSIYLTRGFLDRLDRGAVTVEELASVVAHELGHVAHGHTRRRMVDFAGQNLIGIVLTGVLARIIPGLGPMLGNLVARLIAARLSRQDEFEADAFAAALMTKAGLGTAPQKSLFAKLDRLAGGGGGAQAAWLASHPPAQQRIQAIEALEARWQGSPPRG